MASQSTKITRLATDDPRMSKVVVHGGTVYLSGQVASGDDITAQTKGTLEKIDDLLKLAGTDKSKLLTAQIWVKDIERDFAAMNAVWNEWVDPANKPVRACVQSTMARANILVEVQVTAAL